MNENSGIYWKAIGRRRNSQRGWGAQRGRASGVGIMKIDGKKFSTKLNGCQNEIVEAREQIGIE